MSETEISVKVLTNKGLYEKLKKESQLYQEHCLKKTQQVNRYCKLVVEIVLIMKKKCQ